MKPFRLLVAGLIHDHVWHMLPDFKKIPGVKIVGGADPNKPLRETLRKEFGVTFNSLTETGGLALGENIRILANIQLAKQA